MSVFGVILVRMRENVDQNNSEYGHISRIVNYTEIIISLESIPRL